MSGIGGSSSSAFFWLVVLDLLHIVLLVFFQCGGVKYRLFKNSIMTCITGQTPGFDYINTFIIYYF